MTMLKKFESSEELRKWMQAPTTAKLYKVVFVDLTKNTVKLEGKQTML